MIRDVPAAKRRNRGGERKPSPPGAWRCIRDDLSTLWEVVGAVREEERRRKAVRRGGYDAEDVPGGGGL